jgi:hypothetical protein
MMFTVTLIYRYWIFLLLFSMYSVSVTTCFSKQVFRNWRFAPNVFAVSSINWRRVKVVSLKLDKNWLGYGSGNVMFFNYNLFLKTFFLILTVSSQYFCYIKLQSSQNWIICQMKVSLSKFDLCPILIKPLPPFNR